MEKLYNEHLKHVCASLDRHLSELNYSELFIDAGVLDYYFADDQSKPFRPTPMFNYLCPLKDPGHIIKYQPGRKPVLHFYQPDDFWYDVQPLNQTYWTNHFEIKVCHTDQDTWNELKSTKSSAYIGPSPDKASELGLTANPKDLIDRLDWQRSFKTEYEIECLKKAEELAAKAHMAAKEAFFTGASELEIHQVYMRTLETIEADLPYWSIVALNEKGAILHYEKKRKNRNGDVLLIDSGARFENYCSDITRTYARDSAHEVFRELLNDVEAAELRLCELIKPGLPYPELHHQANVEIYNILTKHNILRDIDGDDAIDEGLVKTFFPHGLGHMLGLQTHDVGGHLADETGNTRPAPERYPKLRTTRTLEPGMVLTVEPGLYFIPLLLNKAKESKFSANFNWDLIETLRPLGGIRIEDNVVVREQGTENLTRPFLA